MTETVKKPTETLTSSPIDGKVIKDKLGRAFTLRNPDLLEKYDFIKALGEDANHQNLVSIMLPILFIAKIDNEVFETPRLYSECRAALKRLKEEGIMAVREAIEEVDGASAEEAKETIKK